MTKADILRAAIRHFPPGKVFAYSDLTETYMKHSAMVIEMNQLVRKGEIARVMRGRFVAVSKGTLTVSPQEIMGAICHYRNKVCGYETGPSIWEKWGLIPAIENRSEYYISIMQMRPAQKHNNITIRFKRARLDPGQYNHEILQFLDALESVNTIVKISDCQTYFETMSRIFRSWNESARNQLSNYSLAYRPVTRAITGAFLQQEGYQNNLGRLAASQHPASTYKVHVNSDCLAHAVEWKIICEKPADEPNKKQKKQTSKKS